MGEFSLTVDVDPPPGEARDSTDGHDGFGHGQFVRDQFPPLIARFERASE